ncbi:unnamed protein product [Cuscuta epithymum]|uniref:Uncharacterized protein n=1 Tax=Cuscuta epithymum TaxID=186058 RepID=A0AAV0EXU4_9ASTE|nr:unnamed protein product [Cuscuta epithymum]
MKLSEPELVGQSCDVVTSKKFWKNRLREEEAQRRSEHPEKSIVSYDIASGSSTKTGRSILIEDGALPWIIQNANSDVSPIRCHVELALCHLAQHSNGITRKKMQKTLSIREPFGSYTAYLMTLPVKK